jgi:hypothetical protein
VFFKSEYRIHPEKRCETGRTSFAAQAKKGDERAVYVPDDALDA